MTTWLEFVKAIPGLGKAVTELIGDVSRVGSSAAKLASAKIDEPRSAVEDRTIQSAAIGRAVTDSKVAIIQAVTKASVEYIDSNARQIGERALAHGVERLIRDHNNREAVVMKTIEHMSENPPPEITQEVPSDDWLNLFGRYAENATSEKMREHWAQMLSGEIRKPGSFSFATLHLASILDEQLAQTIELVRPWIIEKEHIPLVGPFRKGDLYSALLVLASIGFLHLGDHAMFVEDSDNPDSPSRFETDKAVVIIPKTPPATIKLGGNPIIFKNEPSLPAASITRSGLELLSVLPPVEQAAELPEAIKAYFEEQGWKDATLEWVQKKAVAPVSSS
jgi:hypothetical protein